jgi:hypothetical protein
VAAAFRTRPVAFLRVIALLVIVLLSGGNPRWISARQLISRWFVGLSLDAPVWDVTGFTKNREGLLRGDIARPSSRRS